MKHIARIIYYIVIVFHVEHLVRLFILLLCWYY